MTSYERGALVDRVAASGHSYEVADQMVAGVLDAMGVQINDDELLSRTGLGAVELMVPLGALMKYGKASEVYRTCEGLSVFARSVRIGGDDDLDGVAPV
jgi:hypothetical protein